MQVLPVVSRFVWALPVLVALIANPGSASAGQYKVLHDFTGGQGGENGPSPGTLLIDGQGNLYGSTPGGGRNGCGGYGCGTIFKLVPRSQGSWEEIVLYAFPNGKDGFPNSSLAFDAKGNLYGTARWDGGISRGTVFKLTQGTQGWNIKVLYQPGDDVGPVLDKAGNVYGSFGLGSGSGAISELINGSHGWKLKTLYSFCSQTGCADGEDPLAPLSWDANGNLYGTTYFGGNGPPNCHGSAGCGVAFQLTHNSDGSWTYHVLHRFANLKTDGQYPYGGLTVDGKGNVFGTTTHGGNYDNGTVFELTPTSGGGWKQTVLYDFQSIYLGGAPWANLLFDKAGNLYGSAGGGDLSCPGTCGVIFKLTPQAGGKRKYSLVHKFNGTDGDGPNGLTMDGTGNFYGTTMSGGQYNYGVAFELTP
jgi:hypothetical protein